MSARRKSIFLLDRNRTEIKDNMMVKEIAAKLGGSKQEQPQTLHKMVMDLHTGEAIINKTLMPFWIAFSGLQMLLLTLTGCWFVFRKNRV